MVAIAARTYGNIEKSNANNELYHNIDPDVPSMREQADNVV